MRCFSLSAEDSESLPRNLTQVKAAFWLTLSKFLRQDYLKLRNRGLIFDSTVDGSNRSVSQRFTAATSLCHK